MTINLDYSPETFIYNGAGPYLFSFDVARTEYVKVSIDGVENTDITIALSGAAPVYSGGSVTLNTPPGGFQVTVFRVTDPTQLVDYQPYDKFPAETHEFALDKLTMLVQELLSYGNGTYTAPWQRPVAMVQYSITNGEIGVTHGCSVTATGVPADGVDILLDSPASAMENIRILDMGKSNVGFGPEGILSYFVNDDQNISVYAVSGEDGVTAQPFAGNLLIYDSGADDLPIPPPVDTVQAWRLPVAMVSIDSTDGPSGAEIGTTQGCTAVWTGSEITGVLVTLQFPVSSKENMRIAALPSTIALLPQGVPAFQKIDNQSFYIQAVLLGDDGIARGFMKNVDIMVWDAGAE